MLFKQIVVGNLYHDIYIFCETHSINEECIQFDNYLIYSNNRVSPPNVLKGSGGVALALHNSVVSSHTILSVIKGEDGQIALKMKCNTTELLIGILGLYIYHQIHTGMVRTLSNFSIKLQYYGRNFQTVT